jgi:hypothetical protein
MAPRAHLALFATSKETAANAIWASGLSRAVRSVAVGLLGAATVLSLMAVLGPIITS